MPSHDEPPFWKCEGKAESTLRNHSIALSMASDCTATPMLVSEASDAGTGTSGPSRPKGRAGNPARATRDGFSAARPMSTYL